MEIVQEASDVFSFQMLTPRFCADLVRRSRGVAWSRAKVLDAVSGLKRYRPSDRECLDCPLERLPSLQRRWRESYERAVLDVASVCWQWPLTRCDEVGLARYEKGGRYRTHVDYVPGRAVPPRVLSLICYLNDDFSGGRTVFPRQKHAVEPRPGKAVIFPAGISHPHGAEPVRDRTRFVLVGLLR